MFESLDDILERLPESRRTKIEMDANHLALAIEASHLKANDVASFERHLRDGGAKLIAKMPDEREVDLPQSFDRSDGEHAQGEE